MFALDIELRNALDPPCKIRIDRFGWIFCPGGKVMRLENDYDKDVYNGELGASLTESQNTRSRI